ncbi:hypothetical protein TOT_040000011 [Theileria orientalis strain Shintoku]|uniref:Uncharacterized protein n=1 Tax=Theileria orientalis strain Shintoku TaxID=869250 RepID=J4DNX7_THEOR|nr:hypothetical protein TOT_020000002 [Theileria orientalis strain Shintoku]XP_009691931.1 hypothetical protein TOT_040000011 [Theileria orientalis strain Shintoku]BAM39729.1 hypothetical protein TOT_020000002 [Theileria orientalis strain Shintoku]BAM41630.1 hypothetical protein TOT_040000011 [Theileria orientalis strain Shintoku]|eukprot:XP_009690030.1 hypothetical protein TOT_020000002 [Theileria orientalis strain Shintoku]
MTGLRNVKDKTTLFPYIAVSFNSIVVLQEDVKVSHRILVELKNPVSQFIQIHRVKRGDLNHFVKCKNKSIVTCAVIKLITKIRSFRGVCD